MKHMKRGLSWLLVLCMIASMLSLSAFAADETEATPAEEPAVEEAAAEAEPAAEAEEPTVEAEEPAVEAEETEEPAEEEAFEAEDEAMLATTGTKPADGTTSNQPYISNTTGGSQYFRIPAMVTLDNGTIVTAADARWNGTSDGGGHDTVVSYSTDKGTTWNYTFANYLGDNGNTHSIASTCFLDPALATDGSNVYMLVDLFPAGYALNGAANTPVAGANGFDDSGRLKLSGNNRKSYGYYLSGDTIYSNEGTPVSGLTVDGKFNVTGTYNGTTYDTNLFCADSPFLVYPTNYLYLTKSTDGGKTWGNPTLINVKKAAEQTCLVGPGSGIVVTLDSGKSRIIYTVYNYTSGDKNTSVIYSDDGGVTWTRSDDMNAISSEATLTEVKVGSTNYLYMFTRHGGYYTSTDNGETWSSQQSVSDISYNTSCQINVMTYSKTIDGKQAILLSAPGSTSSRSNGKIFVGLIQDNGSISWNYTYSVNTDTYQYSCLTELSDGSIGLLYEPADGTVSYMNLAISTIASGATIGTDDSGEEDEDDSGESSDTEVTDTQDVTVYVGASKTYTDDTGNYQSTYTGEGLVTSVATVAVKGTTTSGGTEITKQTSITSGSKYYIKTTSGEYYTSTGSTTTDISRAAQWTATNSGSGYTLKNGSNYLRYSSGQSKITVGTNSTTYTFSDGTFTYSYKNGPGTYTGTLGSPVTVTEKQAVDATEVTITGVAVGTTSVIVGNTKYNITVKEKPAVVDMETTPFIVGTNSITTGAGEKLTKLSTSVGTSYDIDLGKDYASLSATWSMADTSIATVDSDGKVTGVAAGETTLYCTINGLTYAMPIVVYNTGSSSASSTKICSLHTTEISNTEVWYAWNLLTGNDNMPTTMIKAVDGEAIYVAFPSDDAYCINYYGAPDDGYALTFMSATNSEGQYLAVDDKDDVTQCDWYANSGACYNERSNQTYISSSSTRLTTIQNEIKTAISTGKEYIKEGISAEGLSIDGAQGFSRGTTGTDNTNCDLTFRSERLPTVDKTITGIVRSGENTITPYAEGMTAAVGDKVYFKVTVTQYATTEAIEYTSDKLTDKLTGASFGTLNGSTFTSDRTLTKSGMLSDSTLSENKTYSYDVEYTIQDSDLDKNIVNTVDLTYNYSSTYSSGTFAGSANASAKISAPSFDPDDIVVDFGLPVTMDYSETDAHGRYDLASGTATYGVVTVSGNKVTYTPNKVLMDVDTVTLTNTAGGTYTFKVYPATTVYYEASDNFVTYSSNNWTNAGTAPTTQKPAVLGSDTNNYGYDAAYSGTAADAYVTATSTGVTKATFTFTGNGVDLYAVCNKSSGTANVIVKNDEGEIADFVRVDTASYNGKSDLTTYPDGNLYNVPVFSLTGLDYDTYTVTVITATADFVLDGFRVYNTLEDSSVFDKDNEDNPTFIEARDLNFANVNLATDSKKYASEIYEQVYKQVTDQSVQAVITSKSETVNASQDLIDNGPKNEIYLYPGMTLTLTMDTKREVQVGLRGLQNGFTCKIGTTDQDVSTTDMFYTVKEQGSTNTIVITNPTDSNSILAVTKIKVCDDPSVIGTITEEDVLNTLYTLGYENETTQTENPFTDVKTSGSYFNAIVWAVGKGVTTGKTATTFAPDDYCTRAQAVTFLWRAAGEPKPAEGTVNPFKDVAEGKYYYNAVLWAVEQGITTGKTADTFAPDEVCSRANIITFINRWAGNATAAADFADPFTDVAAGKYYYNPVLWGAEQGVVKGVTTDTFKPNDSCTRAQIVTFLYRYVTSK